jgi:exonuclease SbcD
VRLLHTSDWHIGRALHRTSLLDAQASFVDFLVELVVAERIDVVLIAGDLYDRAIPPSDAVTLFGEALARLHATGAGVVAISGNHDSAERLDFASSLLATTGIHVRCAAASIATPVLFHDADGPVAFYAIPYLEPDLRWQALGADGPRHRAVLDAAMGLVRADLAAHRRPRSVVLAHGFVGGDHPPDECASERNVSIGGSALVPTSVFDGVDYVALGHLHGRQSPAATITYSGTPLAYSFSEASHTKSVSIVELSADGSITLMPVPTPVTRRLATVRARLDDVLTNPSFSEYEDAFLAVTLLDELRPREPIAQLRARFPHVLTLDFEAPTSVVSGLSYTTRLRGLGDYETAERFVADVRGTPATDAEQALLHRAVEQARVAAEADTAQVVSEAAG